MMEAAAVEFQVSIVWGWDEGRTEMSIGQSGRWWQFEAVHCCAVQRSKQVFGTSEHEKTPPI